MRWSFGGEWGIRTPEGFHPTRFPSVRHRPLGEFSWWASALQAQTTSRNHSWSHSKHLTGGQATIGVAPRVAPSRPTPPGRKRSKGNRALAGARGVFTFCGAAAPAAPRASARRTRRRASRPRRRFARPAAMVCAHRASRASRHGGVSLDRVPRWFASTSHSLGVWRRASISRRPKDTPVSLRSRSASSTLCCVGSSGWASFVR